MLPNTKVQRYFMSEGKNKPSGHRWRQFAGVQGSRQDQAAFQRHARGHDVEVDVEKEPEIEPVGYQPEIGIEIN